MCFSAKLMHINKVKLILYRLKSNFYLPLLFIDTQVSQTYNAFTLTAVISLIFSTLRALPTLPFLLLPLAMFLKLYPCSTHSPPLSKTSFSFVFKGGQERNIKRDEYIKQNIKWDNATGHNNTIRKVFIGIGNSNHVINPRLDI